jgi:hypothetical protein
MDLESSANDAANEIHHLYPKTIAQGIACQLYEEGV